MLFTKQNTKIRKIPNKLKKITYHLKQVTYYGILYGGLGLTSYWVFFNSNSLYIHHKVQCIFCTKNTKCSTNVHLYSKKGWKKQDSHTESICRELETKHIFSFIYRERCPISPSLRIRLEPSSIKYWWPPSQDA